MRRWRGLLPPAVVLAAGLAGAGCETCRPLQFGVVNVATFDHVEVLRGARSNAIPVTVWVPVDVEATAISNALGAARSVGVEVRADKSGGQ